MIDGWIWTGVNYPIKNTNWAINEPTQTINLAQACVYLNNGYMYDTSCSNTFDLQYICEENCRHKSREIKEVEPKDLVNLGGRNYYFGLGTVSSHFYTITCKK
jgi:hypothetical protein